MNHAQCLLNMAKKPFVIIFSIIIIILCWNFVDLPLAARVESSHFQSIKSLIKLLGIAGKWYLSIGILLMLMLWYYWRKQYDCAYRALFIALCVFLPNLIALIIKVSLARARPDLYFQIDHFGFYFFKFNHDYWSMPSGHATTAVALMIGVSLLYPRWFYPLLMLAILVILSRILSGMHYLSDVLTGTLLSLVVLAYTQPYIARWTIKQES